MNVLDKNLIWEQKSISVFELIFAPFFNFILFFNFVFRFIAFSFYFLISFSPTVMPTL